MSGRKLLPAFRYRFSATIKSLAAFFLAILAIMTGLTFVFASEGMNINSSFTGFGIAGTVMFFIVGIITIREDFRLMMQNGVGRGTILTSNILALFALSILLAVTGELMTAAFQAVNVSEIGLRISDLFYLIYFPDSNWNPSLAARVQNILLSTGLYVCADLMGMFFSLLFYRLSKAATIIVAVGATLLLTVGLPVLAARRFIPTWLMNAVSAVARAAVRTPWTLLLTFVILSSMAVFINWMLLRRAPVKPARI